MASAAPEKIQNAFSATAHLFQLNHTHTQNSYSYSVLGKVMSLTVSSSIKVISTVGLGLIAGYAIASPFLITPTVYKLSTRTNAPALTRTQVTSGRVVAGSAGLIGTLLACVYASSDDHVGRHPYLLYSSLLALATATTTELGATQRAIRIGSINVDDMNGEDLAREFEGLVRAGYFVSGLSLIAFAISAVGNYGDYY